MADDSNTLHNNAIGWSILAVITILIIWLFWYFFQTEIRDAVRWVRYGQMLLIGFFVDADFSVVYGDQNVSFSQGLEDTPQWNAAELSYFHLSYFNALAMQPLKLPFAIVFCVLAAMALFNGPQSYYRQRMGLQQLIERQSENFPAISPFIKFNPSSQPPRPPGSPVPAELPDFAEALGPEEWLAYYEVNVKDGQIQEESAKQQFTKQLIGRWKGPSKLAPHQQVLLASFCLRAARKRGDSDMMLGRIARCWSADKSLDLSQDKKLMKDAQAVLRNKEIAGETLKMCNRHAFVTTALIRALDYARSEGGVLAPAMFVWLRAYDRTLWYPLNNHGRQSLHMEALGAHAHYKQEKRTQRPIPVPKVDDAVHTITEYMRSASARPIPKLDYKDSNKKAIKKAV